MLSMQLEKLDPTLKLLTAQRLADMPWLEEIVDAQLAVATVKVLQLDATHEHFVIDYAISRKEIDLLNDLKSLFTLDETSTENAENENA